MGTKEPSPPKQKRKRERPEGCKAPGGAAQGGEWGRGGCRAGPATGLDTPLVLLVLLGGRIRGRHGRVAGRGGGRARRPRRILLRILLGVGAEARSCQNGPRGRQSARAVHAQELDLWHAAQAVAFWCHSGGGIANRRRGSVVPYKKHGPIRNVVPSERPGPLKAVRSFRMGVGLPDPGAALIESTYRRVQGRNAATDGLTLTRGPSRGGSKQGPGLWSHPISFPPLPRVAPSRAPGRPRSALWNELLSGSRVKGKQTCEGRNKVRLLAEGEYADANLLHILGLCAAQRKSPGGETQSAE